MLGQNFNVEADLRTKQARKVDLHVGKEHVNMNVKHGLKLGSQKDVSIKTGTQQ